MLRLNWSSRMIAATSVSGVSRQPAALVLSTSSRTLPNRSAMCRSTLGSFLKCCSSVSSSHQKWMTARARSAGPPFTWSACPWAGHPVAAPSPARRRPIRTAPAGLAKIAAILWAAAVALRHPVHRPRLLDRLLGTDRIAFFQELGEGGADALCDQILHCLGQVGEGGVAVYALQVAQHIVGNAALTRPSSLPARRSPPTG